VLRDQGRLVEAEPLLRSALEGTRATLGPLHPRALTVLGNLGKVLSLFPLTSISSSLGKYTISDTSEIPKPGM
jgi:hypothetical protein